MILININAGTMNRTLEKEKYGDSRLGQREVGLPCQTLYHGELGYSAFTWRLGLGQSKKNAQWRHPTFFSFLLLVAAFCVYSYALIIKHIKNNITKFTVLHEFYFFY